MSVKQIRAYIRQLNSEDEATRLEAVDGLGRFGPLAVEAVPSMVKLLRESSAAMRYRTANALGRLGPAAAAAVPNLVRSLTDHSPGVRNAVVRALGRLGPVCLPQLAIALRFNKPEGRTQAARALAELGPDAGAAVPALLAALADDHFATRAAAARALATIGQSVDEALDIIVEILKQEPPETRPDLALTLAAFPRVAEAAVPILVAMIKADPEEARGDAVVALGKLGAAAVAAIPALLAVQAEPDSPLKLPALAALGRIGPAAAPAVPELLRLLQEGGEKRSITIVEALGNIGPAAAQAVPALIRLLESSYGQLRESITLALGQIGPEAAPAVPALLRGLRDSAPNVRATALKALAAIGPRAGTVAEVLEALRDPDPAVRLAAVEAVAGLQIPAEQAAQPLLARLEDRDIQVRRAAARLLGKLRVGAQLVESRFLEALESPYGEVRRDAAEFLWEVAGRADLALPILRESIADPDRGVREHSLQLLGRIALDEPQAIPIIVQALKNPDEPLGRPAANALLALGERAAATLGQALSSAEKALRDGALQVLARLGSAGEAAIPALLPILEDEEPEVRASTVRIIAQIGRGVQSVAPALVQLFDDEVEPVRSWAALAFQKYGAAGVPYLIPALKRDQTRIKLAALEACVHIGPDALEASGAVGALLNDRDSNVRLWARRALESIGARVKTTAEPLVRILGDAIAEYRDWAALCLVQQGRVVVPPLLQALTLPNVRSRYMAAEALGQLGEQAALAVPLLIHALDQKTFKFADDQEQYEEPEEDYSEDEDEWEEDEWEEEEEEWEEEEPEDEADQETPPAERITLQKIQDRCARAIAEVGTAAVPALVEGLARPERNVRLGVIDALARIGPAAEPAIADLVRLIREDEDRVVRHAAAEALAAIGASAVQALCQAFEGANDRIRARLAQALGVIGPGAVAATNILAELLGSSEPTVRREAAWAVGRVGSRGQGIHDALIQSLLRTTRDSDSITREQAALALGRLGAQALMVLDELKAQASADDPNLRRSALVAVGELLGSVLSPGQAAQVMQAMTPALTQALGDADRDIRMQAVQALTALRDPAAAVLPRIELLTRALEDSQEAIRVRAIEGLAALGKAVEPQLRAALNQPNQLVRRGAFQALIELKPADVVELLARGITDPDWEIGRISAERLAGMGAEAKAALPALCQALSSRVNTVREEAFKTLQKLDPRGEYTYKALMEALVAPGRQVRVWAAERISRYDKAIEAVPLLVLLTPGKFYTDGQVYCQAVQKFGSKAVPHIVGLLTNEDKMLRERAMQALQRLHYSAYRSLEPHAKHLHNPPPDVQKKLKNAFRGFGSDTGGEKTPTVRGLISKLKSKYNWWERNQAAVALGKMGKKAVAAIKPLIEALKDHDSDVLTNASEALGLIGPPEANEAIPDLRRLSGHHYPQVKAAAIRALARLGVCDEPLIKSMAGMLGKDANPAEARDIAEILSRQGAQAAPAIKGLRESLQSRDLNLRVWSAWALGCIGPDAREAAAEIKELLREAHPRVLIWAACAYQRLTGDAAAVLPVLRCVLTCREPDVRAGCACLVLQLGDDGLAELVGLLEHAEARMRAGAVEVIGKLQAGNPDAAEVVEALLQDPDPEVRTNAKTALESIQKGTPVTTWEPVSVVKPRKDAS